MMFDELDDDLADQDLNKLTKANSKVLEAINNKIAENYDPRTKTVGDKVLVWDVSRLTYADDNQDVTNINEDFTVNNYESIVIEDNCRYIAKVITFAGDFSKTLDLVVWNKKLNKRFRTSSEFVKLI